MPLEQIWSAVGALSKHARTVRFPSHAVPALILFVRSSILGVAKSAASDSVQWLNPKPTKPTEPTEPAKRSNEPPNEPSAKRRCDEPTEPTKYNQKDEFRCNVTSEERDGRNLLPGGPYCSRLGSAAMRNALRKVAYYPNLFEGSHLLHLAPHPDSVIPGRPGRRFGICQ
jgi:hypothetical protein